MDKITKNGEEMAREKISRSQYLELKKNYLEKNRTMHSLYIQLNEETPITRQLFFRLINRIRQEEGLGSYYTSKKQKKRKNVIENLDKSPNHYNT